MGKKPAIAWVGTFWFGVALAGGGCESTTPKHTYNPQPMIGQHTVPAPTTGTATATVPTPPTGTATATVPTAPTGAGAGTTVTAPTGVDASRTITPTTSNTDSGPVISPPGAPGSANGFQTQPRSSVTPPSAPLEDPNPRLAIPVTDQRVPPAPVQGSRYGSDQKPAPLDPPPVPMNALPAAAATPPPRSSVSFDDGVGGKELGSVPEASPRSTGFDSSPKFSPPPSGLVLPTPSGPVETGVQSIAPPPPSSGSVPLPPVGGTDHDPFGK